MLNALQEYPWGHIEPVGDLRNYFDSRVATSRLYSSNVRQVQTGEFGKAFLSQATFVSDAAYVGREGVERLHVFPSLLAWQDAVYG